MVRFLVAEVDVAQRLSPEVRRQVIRLAAKGRTYRQIIDEAGVSMGMVTIITKPLGGVIRPELYEPSDKRLSLDDRVDIRIWLEQGESFAEIGRRLGRVTSTISREVRGVAGRAGYRPMAAHRRAGQRARRPKPTKLGSNPVLCRRVIEDLEELWSPEEIDGRLRFEFPDQPEMWVSHETIYKSVYIEGRGELRRELTRCLRTGRTKRQAGPGTTAGPDPRHRSHRGPSGRSRWAAGARPLGRRPARRGRQPLCGRHPRGPGVAVHDVVAPA